MSVSTSKVFVREVELKAEGDGKARLVAEASIAMDWEDIMKIRVLHTDKQGDYFLVDDVRAWAETLLKLCDQTPRTPMPTEEVRRLKLNA